MRSGSEAVFLHPVSRFRFRRAGNAVMLSSDAWEMNRAVIGGPIIYALYLT